MRFVPSIGALLISLWLGAVGIGMASLWAYTMAPGQSAAAPGRWPADSPLPRASGQAALVLLAHPQCPCSRASVHELSRLMARAQGRLAAYVLFFLPQGYDEAWAKTDLWSSAAAIPGVSVRLDPAGSEARRFGALTSGQVLLYSTEGDLLFSGGSRPPGGIRATIREAAPSSLRSTIQPRSWAALLCSAAR
jgi:hypothetical protein